MDFYQAVQMRRSVRKISERPIPQEVLNRIFAATLRAPSWANTQAVRWIIVTDPNIKADLSAALSPGNPSQATIIRAPIVLGLCFQKSRSGFYKGKASTSLGDWGIFDAGLAAAQLTLAAAAEGLGTVHVGAINIDMAAQMLNVPENVQLVELIPLGYPDQFPELTPRLPHEKIYFTEKYRSDI